MMEPGTSLVKGRGYMTAHLTPPSWHGWAEASRLGGVTYTALIEAIGLHLAEHGHEVKMDMKIILKRARIIDAQRKARIGIAGRKPWKNVTGGD